MLRLLLFFILLNFSIFVSCRDAEAQDQPNPSTSAGLEELPAETMTYRLAPLNVKGTIENSATGRSRISGEVIPHLPRENGSVNEMLKVFPDVHLDQRFSNSLSGGEILPPEVSISGGRSYQNNFTLDGLGNNSLLDPSLKNINQLNDVPGHSQELFLDSDLVENITVFDSNVPARFGNFTGGVVEIETRNPRPEFGGKITYRHTRDDWTEFHVSGEDFHEFRQGSDPNKQPEFEKHDAGLELNLPLGNNQGLLAAYRVLASKIPLYNLGETKNQSRILHNIFVKYQNLLTDSSILDLSFKATPYQSEHFIPEAANSKFTITGGGYALNTGLAIAFPDWELEVRGGYLYSENSREAPHVWRPWATLGSTTWGRAISSDASNEGGFGDIEKTQHDLQFSVNLASYPVQTQWGNHQWNTGFDLERIEGTYDRTETGIVYRSPYFSDRVICNEDLLGCIDNEQFFSRRNIYPKGSTSATLVRAAAYADDKMALGRLELRPGLRLSYDDFMQNVNLAPRLAGSLDIFGTEGTLFIFGFNRYYGQTLLTYKLREAIRPYIPQERSLGAPVPTPTTWDELPPGLRQVSRFSQLDTPYSDEAAVGIDQQLLGGRLSLKFVYRESKDEFAKRYDDLDEAGLRPYTLSNDGHSRHRSWRATWERNWQRHFVSLNATWRDTQRSNTDFDTAVVEEESTDERAWYQGKLVFQDQLPEEDDLPVEVRLTWIAQLPWGLTFTNFATYRGSYDRVVNTQNSEELPPSEKEDPESAESAYVYVDYHEPESWLFDWKLSFETELAQHQRIRLNLEINNIFNEKVMTDPVLLRYETGRQFWAGVEYFF